MSSAVAPSQSTGNSFSVGPPAFAAGADSPAPANQAQADLFVSVHANYSDLATARGVETYYTNFSVTTEPSYIEKRENATAQTLSIRAESSTMSVKERTDQSRKLAASVERALYGTLAPKNPGLRDRGVKEASFVVLTGTSMPAEKKGSFSIWKRNRKYHSGRAG